MFLISFFFLAYSLSEIKKTKRLLINVTLAIAVQEMEEKVCDRKIMVHFLPFAEYKNKKRFLLILIHSLYNIAAYIFLKLHSLKTRRESFSLIEHEST